MNINSLTSQISATRALGGRLDMTSQAPASPERAERPRTADPMVGTIPGVLSDRETKAIAALFTSSQPNTYTFHGTPLSAPVKPGLHIDVQA